MVTLTKQSNNSQGQRPMPARGGARRGSMKDAIKNNTISKGTVKRLLAYFKPHLFKLVIVIIAIILTALASVQASLFIENVIDDYITPMIATGSTDFSGLARFMLKILAILSCGAICGYVYARLMAVTSQTIQKKIRDEMFEKMQKLPIGFFDSHTHGDLMSYYTNDIDTLREFFSRTFPQLINSTITIVTVFTAMIAESWILTIVVVATLLLKFKVAEKLGGRSGKYFAKQQAAVGALNGYIEEMVNGSKVVKTFCREDKVNEEFDELNDNLRYNAAEANKAGNMMMPILANMNHIETVLIAIIGGALAISGFSGLTLGKLAAFIQLAKSFGRPIDMMSQQVNIVMLALAGADRIFKLMDEEPEHDEGYVTLVNARRDSEGNITEADMHTGLWAWKHPHGDGTLTYTELKGDVRFFDVDFSYVEGKQILHDITLYGKPGQKIAFVGATGAGKTTITNLINRFYDIEDGKIRYDAININKIKKPDLRRSLGMVLQDVNLFTGTVRENIRYGKLDATDEEVEAAAKLVNADGFIRMLPNGYDTMISEEEGSLSQGQRQLISIARAAIADPPVMIMDEATSSIDTRTEMIVQKGMDALMKGRTVFVIAHRLSTIRNANAIVVLDHGRIIERGNHEDLMKQKGIYYQMYTGASENTLTGI